MPHKVVKYSSPLSTFLKQNVCEHLWCQKQYVKVDISTNMIYPQPLRASKDIKGHLATRQFCIKGARRGLKAGSANFALFVEVGHDPVSEMLLSH